MQSAVEADLAQLELLFAIHRRMEPAIDTREIMKEIGARIREELDYRREARHAAAYAVMLEKVERGARAARLARAFDRAPAHPRLARRHAPPHPCEGRSRDAQSPRGRDVQGLVAALLELRHHPWRSASWKLHRVPERGRRARRGLAASIFSTTAASASSRRASSRGWSISIAGCMERDEARIVHAYETWGFQGLSRDLIEVLNIWARFIYGPLIEDRVRTIADGVKPGEYGRREAYQVHMALKKKGPVTVPREFVFMDRAAIGLGAVFLHLAAELNFHRLFEEAIEDFQRHARSRPARRACSVASGFTQPDRHDCKTTLSNCAPARVLLSRCLELLSNFEDERWRRRPTFRKWTTRSMSAPSAGSALHRDRHRACPVHRGRSSRSGDVKHSGGWALFGFVLTLATTIVGAFSPALAWRPLAGVLWRCCCSSSLSCEPSMIVASDVRGPMRPRPASRSRPKPRKSSPGSAPK